MEYRTLGRTGMKVSHMSFGSSALGSVYRPTELEESCHVVKQALRGGINYIDTAPWYGHGKAETVLGKALKDVARDSYYIATKVGRYAPELDKMFDFSAGKTLSSVDESLQRLGIDYVDVIQVHDVEFAPSLDIILNETLPALQQVKEAGKARFIGITGYPLDILKQIIEGSKVKIDTILTYCHLCMNDSSLLDNLDYFKEKGIGVINASPISMGLLTHGGPPDWHPALPVIKHACADAAKLCQERGVNLSRLAMKYSYSFNGIPTTLVSTASTANLQRNLDTLNTELTHLETRTLDDVMNRFMKPLNHMTWEKEEMEDYQKQLKDHKHGVWGITSTG